MYRNRVYVLLVPIKQYKVKNSFLVTSVTSAYFDTTQSFTQSGLMRLDMGFLLHTNMFIP